MSHISESIFILKTRQRFYDIWNKNSGQKCGLWPSESCYCVRTQKPMQTTVYFCFHIMLCQWISGSHCFQGSWCLTLERDSTMNPWNIGNQSSNDIVSHPIRHESSVALLRQPDISQALNSFTNEFTFPDEMKYCSHTLLLTEWVGIRTYSLMLVPACYNTHT